MLSVSAPVALAIGIGLSEIHLLYMNMKCTMTL